MWFRVIVALVLTVGFLVGIRLMQSPRTARRGNALGAASMALAIVFTLGWQSALGNPVIWLLLGIGALLGYILADRVRMVQMPQMVGLFNGLGGLASALVAGAAVGSGSVENAFFFLTAAVALGLGTVTFSGSVVAAMKLHGVISGRAVVRRTDNLVLSLLGVVVLASVAVSTLGSARGFAVSMPFNIVAALVIGYVGALRIGGADMPVVISFLNSLSGIAAAVCGLAVSDMLLAGVGALVGVAGMILTQIMCGAINRSLAGLFRGSVPARPAMQPEEVVPAAETATDGAADELGLPAQVAVDDLPELLRKAERVIIVPGYGMAVAQAQHAVGELVSVLEAKGKTVRIAIHPVAGRMPGHMNVLLAEAGLDYEKFVDMDEINPEFSNTDEIGRASCRERV